MSLSNDDVKRVANLARLAFSDEQVSSMANQLSRVVDLVAQLSVVDTTGVEPMVHAIELHNVLADDVILPSLPRDEALKNAPSSDAECFRVPPVLG